VRRFAVLLVAIVWLASPSSAQDPRQPKPSAVKVPTGYRIEAIAINLSVPTTAIFDGNDLLIAESGWAAQRSPGSFALS
jgi:hypothetical protein